MSKYTTLFFDLDGTLWDLKKNTELTLHDLWIHWDMEALKPGGFKKFYQRYTFQNDAVWALYRDNKIEKEVLRVVRFEKALEDMDLIWPQAQVRQFADQFMERCPRQPHLLPGAMEILNAVKGKFNLAIITNGFSEVQVIKMNASGIDQFFDEIIYSEDLGIKKPHPEIFHLAMQRANCTADQALMIGDDWDADIIGAMGVGMDQVYLSTTEDQLNQIREADGLKPLRHNRQPSFRINNLNELHGILNLN